MGGDVKFLLGQTSLPKCGALHAVHHLLIQPQCEILDARTQD